MKLYKGEVDLDLDGKHWYHVRGSNLLVPNDGKFHFSPGVTNVTSLLAKPKLIGWAAKTAADVWKERVQEVLDSGGDEAVINDIYEESISEHDKQKRAAGFIGTLIHDYLKLTRLGKTPVPLKNKRAQDSVARARKWEKDNVKKWIIVERSLYSKEYHYAGTPDGIYQHKKGGIGLDDIKTGAAVYKEYCLQTAGYVRAAIEEGIISSVSYRNITHINKKTGALNPCILEIEFESTWEQDFSAFLGLRAVYQWEKKI